MITRFFIYGAAGLNTEILWTGLSALLKDDFNMIGHTSLWMFLVYATAGCILEMIYEVIKEYNFFVRGCVWTVLIFFAETVSGCVFWEIGIEPWRYHTPLSVYGLIRLDYLPAWFFVGLVYEKLYYCLTRTKKQKE